MRQDVSQIDQLNTVQDGLQFYRNQLTINRRYFLFGCSLVIEIGCGTAYAFGIFSHKIKESMHYTQAQVDLVGSIGDIGMFLGLVSGLFYTRFGGRTTLLVGGTMTVVGFFVLHLFISQVIEASLTAVCLTFFVALLGNSFRSNATTAVVLNSFPAKDRGKVVGLVKGYFAMGASVFAQFYASLFKPDVSSFLVFVSAMVFLSVLFAYPFFEIVPLEVSDQESNQPTSAATASSSKSFRPWIVLSIFLALFLFSTAVIRYYAEIVPWVKIINAGVTFAVIVFFIIYPFFIIDDNNYANGDGNSIQVSESENENDQTILNSEEATNGDNVVKLRPLHQDREVEVENLNSASEILHHSAPTDTMLTKLNQDDVIVHNRILQTVQTLNFYLIFVVFFVLSGSGLVIINNVTQIEYAYTKEHTIQLHVCLIGLGNFVGRIGYGYLSDSKPNVSRVWFLYSVCMGMCATQFLLSIFSSSFVVIFCSFLCGFFYGGCFCLVPTTIADLFGSKYFAENYGAVDLAPAMGSLFFATFITNYFYRDEVVSNVGPNNNSAIEVEDCFGSDCFEHTFYTTTLSCLFASFICIYLALRTKHIVPQALHTH